MDDITSVSLAPLQPSGTTEGLVLQRLPLARDLSLRALYVRAGSADPAQPPRWRMQNGRVSASRGVVLSFDSYFGAFFEQAWRGPTALRSLVLDLRVTGSFVLRILRRQVCGEATMLYEEVVRGFEGRLSVPLSAPLSLAVGGRLFAEVAALRDGCAVEALEWRTPDTPVMPVGLVPVFCTFGREEPFGTVLATLAAEPACWRELRRIVVVNQGRPGLASHRALAGLPAAFRSRLHIVEQGNFGGAGGFARGLIEVQNIQGATHALLMDDDVSAEPEALRRAAAFFAIAQPRRALGGHMLDMLRPTRLYEAGGRVDDRKWHLCPLKHDLDLDDSRSLDALTRPEPMHYNGWWFFGLPLALLKEAGLPLPCFIRGDDVEYGVRLQGIGAPIVALPGVAIWHEPFYAKLNGWQLYYETRNMLVAAAIHFPRNRFRLAVLLLKRLLIYLLTYRYYSACLVLRAVEDYLQGPALYEAQPGAIHASLDRYRAEFTPEDFARESVPRYRRLPRDPESLPGFVARLGWSVLRNWAVPTGDALVPVHVEYRDLVWFRVGRFDHLVVETPGDDRLPVFRRSRAAFRRHLTHGARLLLRVLRDGDAVAAAWQLAHPRLTDATAWRCYLGLGRQPDEATAANLPGREKAPPTAEQREEEA
ncbi:MAG: glycosyltransferase [Rhodopila sp.]